MILIKNMSALPLKFLLVGNSAVGKTSIVVRLCNDEFSHSIGSTIGVDFMTYNINIDNQNVKLQIWDTAGQEKYQSVGKAYYRNAVGVVIVFALDNYESFECLDNWYSQVRKYCHPQAEVMVIGNKCDLTKEKCISDSEIQDFVSSRNIRYIESSAKQNKNIYEAFFQISQALLQNIQNGNLVLEQKPEVKNNNNENSNCC